MKQRKLWKMGEDGLCHFSSAIQTRPGPSSLLEERNGTLLCCFPCVVGYPPNRGKRPRYIDRYIDFIMIHLLVLKTTASLSNEMLKL